MRRCCDDNGFDAMTAYPKGDMARSSEDIDAQSDTY
jgi:hypothetical protein